MKLSKKKVFALALAVCLIATLSFGTLAWFTDDDSVTNDFMIAGSENEKPDEIFSVDVWEDDEPEDPENDEKHDKLEFKEILPGDALYKEANVENTGSYDQYIRVKITVSDAAVWQDVYEANMVPVTEFVNLDRTDVYGIGAYLEGDNFAYYVYYKSKLAPDAVMNVFTEAYISEQDRNGVGTIYLGRKHLGNLLDNTGLDFWGGGIGLEAALFDIPDCERVLKLIKRSCRAGSVE